MAKAKWYSPRPRRDLVSQLYFRAQAEGIPMTRLADRLIEDALARPAVVYEEVTTRVAEPSTTTVPG
jgi:ketosteroid isomerase-like protein